jgi:hypothetical protein
MRLKPLTLLSGLALLMSAASMRADLAFVLTPAAQSDVGSNEVTFTGTLINTSLTDNLFLNNIQFDFIDEAGTYLAADTNVFFANVPGILLPSETYSDVVFGITVASNTPPGQYFGIVTIQGGTNIFAATNLASPIFEVSLPPAALGIASSGTNLVLFVAVTAGKFCVATKFRSDHDELADGDEHTDNYKWAESSISCSIHWQRILPAQIPLTGHKLKTSWAELIFQIENCASCGILPSCNLFLPDRFMWCATTLTPTRSSPRNI